jgi:hypothetical protein
MQIDDLILPKTVAKQVREVLGQVVEILNNNGYERKVYTSAPTSTSPGFEGEKRVVITGATLREYMYGSGQWWKSDSTAASGWSAV